MGGMGQVCPGSLGVLIPEASPVCRAARFVLSPCLARIRCLFARSVGIRLRGASTARLSSLPAVCLQAHDFGGDDDGGLEETSAASAFMSKLGMRTPPSQPRYLPLRPLRPTFVPNSVLEGLMVRGALRFEGI